MKKKEFIYFLSWCWMLNVHGQTISLSSPDNSKTFTLGIEADEINYRIANQAELLGKSAIFLDIDEQPWFKGPYRVLSVKRGQHHADYRLPTGKTAVYHDHYNQAMVIVANRYDERATFEIRSYDDGVAFRFKLYRPRVVVNSDKTTFSFGRTARLYIQKWDKATEGFYDERRIDTMSTDQRYLLPVLIKRDQKNWFLVSESAVNDYPGGELKRQSGSTESMVISLRQPNYAVKDSLVTPWRFFVMGSLNQIVQSTMAENLNPPSNIQDEHWIRPGVAVFPWWGDHHANSNEEVLKKYVDLAARFGWKWIEFDVALVGTDLHTSTQWKTASWITDFTAYAHRNGVSVYGWDEYKALNTAEKRAELFSRYKSLGIDGIKIDFLDSDNSEMMQFRLDALRDAARFKLMVSFHGEAPPRGQRRTWPNLVAQEAVRGEEYYTFKGYPTPNAVHNTTLPFTRNVIGPMDYTPCTFSSTNRSTTMAHELALPFVFECGWMVMADTPESYISSPAAEILKGLSSTWDETRLLAGEPGSFAVMARRKGHNWYIAGINAEEDRKLTLDLRALCRKDQQITLYTDDASGSIAPISRRTRNRMITVHLIKDGGFVFKLKNNN